MSRGRKPKASHLKVLPGGKSRPAAGPVPDAAQPRTKTPPAPKYLNAVARAEWKRVVGELCQRGKYMPLFQTPLATYCAAFSRWRKAEKELKKGLIVTSPKGYPIQSPWLAISNKAQDLMYRIAVETGLTVISQIRAQGAQYALALNDQPADRAAPGGWNDF